MVGGTVRDEMLGQPRKDLDLLVTGVPQPELLRCLRPYGRVQLTGRTFGVLKLLPRGWEGPPIDIALPRTEISTGVGHRDFEVTFDHTLPIETDLGRRDFTINAMAIDLAHGQLLDPFGGHQDLQQRRLRQVSTLAFPEDPLRMLRGIQLAARFALTLEPTTRAAMQEHAAAITTVAAERIAEELHKLFQAQAPSQGFAAMQAVGLLTHVFPELALQAEQRTAEPVGMEALGQMTAVSPAFVRTMRRLDAVQQCPLLTYRGHLDLLLAALLCDDSGPAGVAPSRVVSLAQQRLMALKLTTIGATPALILALITHSAFAITSLATAAALRHFAHDIGFPTVCMLFDLRLADHLAQQLPLEAVLDLRQRLQHEIDQHAPLALKALAINGDDLQQLGIAAGPQMGRILQQLLRHVLDEPEANTRTQLLTLAHELRQQDAP
jgi:tRNA nucleotidyltransferase/poly(A) polymerase